MRRGCSASAPQPSAPRPSWTTRHRLYRHRPSRPPRAERRVTNGPEPALRAFLLTAELLAPGAHGSWSDRPRLVRARELSLRPPRVHVGHRDRARSQRRARHSPLLLQYEVDELNELRTLEAPQAEPGDDERCVLRAV